MSKFSKLLFSFAEVFLIASLQISAFWSSESEIFMLIYGFVHYKVTEFQPLDHSFLVIYC